ncbi:MAG: hypothetical protein COS97_00685 [Candidatus Nealsonbacteria bacterium CG07_land_8_20_14_0_80_40_10]|nr:MAG: hypothetical protein COS97_00685 [Candidatus Nealsonbacteria bacterium CG07_land_8_20_14_0_80_40_10]
MKKNQIIGIISFVVLVTTIVLVAIFWPAKGSKSPVSVEDINAVKLAQHLTDSGAKMYGAYWCSACKQQKDLFGPEAFAKINYVECDPKGQNPQTEECQKEEIGAFPTWKIDGKKYEGVRSLYELAVTSNFK